MVQNIFPMSEQYEEYLIDESKFCGAADSISFPESEEEIVEILMALSGNAVTIQGGKTGITGGAVPQGGHIMNLSHMNRVISSGINADGTGSITVEPGINLMDLRKEISNRFRKEALFWPPNPTETSASVAGIAASGAQGTNRLLYGESGQYIESMRVISYSGNVREVKRGQMMQLSDGRQIEEMDAVLGKEGITGIISSLTLRLIPKPEDIWGIAFFFEQKTDAGEFVDMLKEELPKSEEASVASVEYIDRYSIDLIEARKPAMTKIKELPDVRREVQAMVCIELHGTEDGIEEIAELLMEAAMNCGSDPDEAWAVSGENDVEKLHAFRHGAAETANLFIEEKHREDVRITKLGTDMVMGAEAFSEVLERYETGIRDAGLKGCIFGHALENHLHINLLPENHKEYERGIALIRKWAETAEEKHGQIVTEHGIGKLKQQILGDLLPEAHVRLCRNLKESIAPQSRLNEGNIF